MAKFYFDFSDGQTFERDEVGVELDSLEQACGAASKALGEVVREILLEA